MNKKLIVSIYKTLSDYTRFEVFAAIVAHSNITGKELLSMFKISQPTLSFHINKLKSVKLIKEKKNGQSHHYSADRETQKLLISGSNELYK